MPWPDHEAGGRFFNPECHLVSSVSRGHGRDGQVQEQPAVFRTAVANSRKCVGGHESYIMSSSSSAGEFLRLALALH